VVNQAGNAASENAKPCVELDIVQPGNNLFTVVVRRREPWMTMNDLAGMRGGVESTSLTIIAKNSMPNGCFLLTAQVRSGRKASTIGKMKMRNWLVSNIN